VPDLVQVQLPDGDVLWAQIENVGPHDVAGLRSILGAKGLIEAIRGVGVSVRRGLAEAAPDEIAVEFGLTFALHEDSIVAAIAGFGANTTLKVSMAWRGGSAATDKG